MHTFEKEWAIHFENLLSIREHSISFSVKFKENFNMLLISLVIDK